MAIRARAKLTARAVSAAKPGRHGDGGGLYLVVAPSGARKWVFRFSWRGKVTEMGLGSAQVVTLAEARDRALDARRTLAAGRNPIDIKREKGRVIPTFGEMADRFLEDKKPEWRHARHERQWRWSVEVGCAALRGKPVDAIGVEDVLETLTPHWLATPTTASRLRQRIEAILDAAKARGFRSGDNPAAWRGNLKHLLPKRPKVEVGHYAAMPYDALPDFMARLRAVDKTAARALEFTILTASRSNEAYGVKWEEIDLAKKIWTVPKERMKAGIEHRVPLSARAMEILEAQRAVVGGEFVFPSPFGDKPLSHVTMQREVMRLGANKSTTVHGFRSSFRDWAGHETSFSREVAEQALAHRIGDEAELAYKRGDFLEKRRDLMEAWARYNESKSGQNVVV